MNDIKRLEKFIRMRKQMRILDISEVVGPVSDLEWLHWHKDVLLGLLIGILTLEFIGQRNPIDTLFGGSTVQTIGSLIVLIFLTYLVVELYRTTKLIKIFYRSAIQNTNDLISWIKERSPNENAK